MYSASPALCDIRALAFSICSLMLSHGLAANSPLPLAEQNMHPRVPSVPSRVGQVMPPLNVSLYILQPNLFFIALLNELNIVFSVCFVVALILSRLMLICNNTRIVELADSYTI